MRERKLGIVFLMSFLLLFATAGGQVARGEDVINIGFIGPLSAPGAYEGEKR